MKELRKEIIVQTVKELIWDKIDREGIYEIPSLNSISQKVEKDFYTRAYDIFYGLSFEDIGLSSDDILEVLESENIVYRKCGYILCSLNKILDIKEEL